MYYFQCRKYSALLPNNISLLHVGIKQVLREISRIIQATSGDVVLKHE